MTPEEAITSKVVVLACVTCFIVLVAGISVSSVYISISKQSAERVCAEQKRMTPFCEKLVAK